MAWYDTKQAAVDPDNPAANEQFPFSEHNAMVTYLKDKIIDKAVNDAAIGNDKVLVYKTATSTFVFEAQSAVGAIDDLTDVTISGVPADNEVLAYDTGTSEWINQTAAEAGLATVAGLASYLALAGGTMAGTLNMGDHLIDDVDDIQAFDTSGILFRDNVGAVSIRICSSGSSFLAYYDCNLNSHKLINVTDPTAAQDASTKNYDDTHLFTKEIVTSFTDGYVPVYRTSSGKFEMEAGGGSAGLPVADTTSIVKGSADGTKLVRIEADGISTSTTRVITMPDKDVLLEDSAACMLLSGAQAMTGDLDMGSNKLDMVTRIYGYLDSGWMEIQGGLSASNGASIYLYGEDSGAYPGRLRLAVPNAAKSNLLVAIDIPGVTDAPIVDINYGLDMNAKDIDDIGALILNDATELTIATGAVTATQSYHKIDTQDDDATDDLDYVLGGTTGQKLVIKAANDARTVVVKDGAGNIRLEGDMSLDNTQDTLSLLFDGSSWLETARANNGA